MRTEDASERMHLSLVDSSIDYSDPNPGAYTFDERALGKGSWVVVINSGYNWKQFPEVNSFFGGKKRRVSQNVHGKGQWRLATSLGL